MADGTRIEVRPPLKSAWRAEDDLDDGAVVWKVTGTVNSVAEIGEVLAWLVAALSLSNLPSGICVSDPVLNNIPIHAGGFEQFARYMISSNLYSEAQQAIDPQSITPGNC
jgi:hypothetical protein